MYLFRAQLSLLVAVIIAHPVSVHAEGKYTPMEYFPADKMADTFEKSSGVGFTFKKNKLKNGDISLQGRDKDERLIVTFILDSDEKLQKASFAASVKGFSRKDAMLMKTFLSVFFKKWDPDKWLARNVPRAMYDGDKVIIREGKAIELSHIKFLGIIDLKVRSKESYCKEN